MITKLFLPTVNEKRVFSHIYLVQLCTLILYFSSLISGKTVVLSTSEVVVASIAVTLRFPARPTIVMS